MRTMLSDSGELFAVCQVIGFTQECPWRCPCAYAEGKLSPNYPVPAIIYDVMIEEGIIHCMEVIETADNGMMRRGHITYPWGRA